MSTCTSRQFDSMGQPRATEDRIAASKRAAMLLQVLGTHVSLASRSAGQGEGPDMRIARSRDADRAPGRALPQDAASLARETGSPKL